MVYCSGYYLMVLLNRLYVIEGADLCMCDAGPKYFDYHEGGLGKTYLATKMSS